ncbi:protein LPA2 [Magnolia sinica]|uniref:protein LPA2 n=1 Tax=Magnolia sinica TaxID=86752 RepID=UPI0026593059|nr:protein LPA2 [Magnolia sinica]
MENAAALAIQSPYLLRKPHLIPLSRSIPFFHNRRTSRVRVRAETEEKVSAVAGTTEDDSVSGLPDKSSAGSGTGFGSSSSSSRGEKKKRSRERAAVIRRSPIDKPDLFSESQPSDRQQQQQDVNESAFLLTWLGLGVLILVEGIALAASGFLPEEWDKFFVKYLYPSFTPTVFLFVGGTVAYGVVKYLQGEQSKS